MNVIDPSHIFKGKAWILIKWDIHDEINKVKKEGLVYQLFSLAIT